MCTLKRRLLSTFGFFYLILSSSSLWATATFNFNNNILDLPVVSVAGVGNFRAKLVYDGTNFTLTESDIASSTAVANESVPASFSNATGKVSIPLLEVKFTDGQVQEYSAELALIPGTDPLVFLASSSSFAADISKAQFEVIAPKCFVGEKSHNQLLTCIGKQLNKQGHYKKCKKFTGPDKYICIADLLSTQDWVQALVGSVDSSGAYPVFCCKSGACPYQNHLGSCGYCMLGCDIAGSKECKEKVDKTQCIEE